MSATGAAELLEKFLILTFEQDEETTHNDVYASGKVLAKWEFTLQNAATKKYGITSVTGKFFAEMKTDDVLKASNLIIEISDDDAAWSTLFGTLNSSSLTYEGKSDLETSILERATTTGFSKAFVRIVQYNSVAGGIASAKNIDFKWLIMVKKGDFVSRII